MATGTPAPTLRLPGFARLTLPRTRRGVQSRHALPQPQHSYGATYCTCGYYAGFYRCSLLPLLV
jgi:hypothetical protein